MMMMMTMMKKKRQFNKMLSNKQLNQHNQLNHQSHQILKQLLPQMKLLQTMSMMLH